MSRPKGRAIAIAGLAGILLAAGAASAAPKKRSKKKPAPQTETRDKKTEAPPPAPDIAFPTSTDKRRVIGILDVRIDGAPPDIGAQFQRDLESQVDIEHFFLAPLARMRQIMANSTHWTDGCFVGPCVSDVKKESNADVVLLAALSGAGTSFGWVVTLVRTDSGNVLSQKSERCDVCTVNEALSAAALATVDLLSSIPEKLPDEHPTAVAAPLPPSAFSGAIKRLEHGRRNTAMGLMIAGAAIAAVGTALYFAETPHPTYGVAAATGGIGLAVGGLVLLF